MLTLALSVEISLMGIKCLCSLTYYRYGFVTFRTAEEARKVQEMVWSHLKIVYTFVLNHFQP